METISLCICFIVILFIAISYTCRGFIKDNIKDPQLASLDKDGFVLIQNAFTPEKVLSYLEKCDSENILDVKKDIHANDELLDTIRKHIGDNEYEYQDYIFAIKQASVYTCHRDNNRKPSNKGQQKDSFTILFFLKPMERSLDVIPGSHKTDHMFYFTDPTRSIQVPAGSALLFNANLIHAGSFNITDNNTRIQMKLTHHDDRKIIDFYEKYNKIAKKPNTVPQTLQKIHKHLSCQFPMASDLTQQINIQTSRQGSSIPWIQKLYSKIVYGNSNFYELPDAK
jgi:hypothetical protein